MILKSRSHFEQLDAETLFALNIFHESRGESRKGSEAVAEVVMNRADGDPEKVKDVILQPLAFSWLNQDQLDSYFAWQTQDILSRPGTFEPFRLIAENFLAGRATNHTNGANHYYNPAKASPPWGPKMENVTIIGQHRFGYLPFFLDKKSPSPAV